MSFYSCIGNQLKQYTNLNVPLLYEICAADYFRSYF